MTLRQALEQRIPRVRLPRWNAETYLRLPLLRDGGHGPWAELYDAHNQKTLRIRPGSQRIMMAPHNIDRDTHYEPYTGPIHDLERHHLNFARTYVEA